MCLAQLVDLARQGQAGVGIGDPQGLVAEEVAHDGLAVLVAGHGVGHDGVRVQHEALGQQRVEHQLNRRTPALGLGQAHLGGGAHDGVGRTGDARLVDLGTTFEQELQQGPGRERYEIVRLDGRQGYAAGLDVHHATGLDRRVAATTAGVLGIAAEALGHVDRSSDELIVERQGGGRDVVGHRVVPVAS